jgi:hypothetical protein
LTAIFEFDKLILGRPSETARSIYVAVRVSKLDRLLVSKLHLWMQVFRFARGTKVPLFCLLSLNYDNECLGIRLAPGIQTSKLFTWLISGDAVQYQIEPEMKLIHGVVSSLHHMLGYHFTKIRISVRGKLCLNRLTHFSGSLDR